MSILRGILGIDLGGVIAAGLPAALQVYSSNTALQIAQANLRAEQASATAVQNAEQANTSTVKLIITGGLVLGAGVLAIRALR